MKLKNIDNKEKLADLSFDIAINFDLNEKKLMAPVFLIIFNP